MDIYKVIGGFKLKSLGRAFGHKDRIGKTDLGILKVAFMVAALDGDVTDAEYATFDLLARKCRGYSEQSAAAALDEAMRSAGYLTLLSKRVSDAELVKAFVAEARAALPDGFAYCSVEDVRRAVVTWIAMGMGDGDYSSRERKCIEAIRKLFAELKISRNQMLEERNLLFSPMFRQACGVHGIATPRRIELVSKDFVTRVEHLVSLLGDSASAAKELKNLVANGK